MNSLELNIIVTYVPYSKIEPISAGPFVSWDEVRNFWNKVPNKGSIQSAKVLDITGQVVVELI